MIVQPRAVASLNQSIAKNQQRLATKRSRPEGEEPPKSPMPSSSNDTELIVKRFFARPSRELLDILSKDLKVAAKEMHAAAEGDETIKEHMRALISKEIVIFSIADGRTWAEVKNDKAFISYLEDMLAKHKPAQETTKKEAKRKRTSDANLNAMQAEPAVGAANTFLVPRPATRLSDLAGLDSIEKQVIELILHPLHYPQIYYHLGIAPPTGILLHGPSGSGKSTLANAIAGETGLPYFRVSGPELIGGTAGESEERIRQVFDAALVAAPSILFIDALDVIAAKKDSSQRGMDRRIIAQLYDCIDQLISLNKQAFANKDEENNGEADGNAKSTFAELFPSKPLQTPSDSSDLVKMTQKMVFLVVATSKPDGIDGGVRGRFSREIPLPVPDANARSKILALHCKAMRLDANVDFKELGKMTPGYVGADLVGLGREAGMVAVTRIIQDMKDSASQTHDIAPLSMEIEGEDQQSLSSTNSDVVSFSVRMSDFLFAMKNIVPAGKREGFVMTADVTWGDIGALAEVREELTQQLLEPIAHPERFRALGLDLPAGVLFYGPPGCGKTLLAKALANQSGANFISVKGPELLNMYVGESESRVRQVFARARASAPCMIFFDELDALVPKRSTGWGGGEGSSNGVAERVVNQLLTELDGLESRKDVYIIGATNRLELIDEAMLRPGRLGNLLYVPLPTASERVSILNALVRKVSVGDTVDMEKVAHDARCEGFSGADCSALVREAGLAVIKEISKLRGLDQPAGQDECVKIEGRHFERALQKVRPSVAPQDRKRYENVRQYLKEGLSAIEALRKAFTEEEDDEDAGK
eukprot:gene37077-45004_t